MRTTIATLVGALNERAEAMVSACTTASPSPSAGVTTGPPRNGTGSD